MNEHKGAWSQKDIDEAEKKSKFTITDGDCHGHLFIEITKQIDEEIPESLKFDRGWNGYDYCMLGNDDEYKALGASPDYWEHCCDWFVVRVK